MFKWKTIKVATVKTGIEYIKTYKEIEEKIPSDNFSSAHSRILSAYFICSPYNILIQATRK